LATAVRIEVSVVRAIAGQASRFLR